MPLSPTPLSGTHTHILGYLDYVKSKTVKAYPQKLLKLVLSGEKSHSVVCPYHADLCSPPSLSLHLL